MTKKEKIIAIFFIFSMILLIASSIYTITTNKPQGYEFRIEKWIKTITLNLSQGLPHSVTLNLFQGLKPIRC